MTVVLQIQSPANKVGSGGGGWGLQTYTFLMLHNGLFTLPAHTSTSEKQASLAAIMFGMKRRNHGQHMEHFKHSQGSLTPNCGCSHELQNQSNCFLNGPAVSAFKCLQFRKSFQCDILHTVSVSLKRDAKPIQSIYTLAKKGVEGCFVLVLEVVNMIRQSRGTLQ